MAAKKTVKKATKNTKATKTAQAKIDQMEQMSRNRTAVVLFAVGILLGFLTFVKGDGLWEKAHYLLFGLFGLSAYFVMLICIYFAVMLTRGKSVDFIKIKGIQASLLILLISGTIEVFGELPQNQGLARVIQKLYEEGTEKQGGGALAIITAGPLSKVGSSPIPEIIILLALFVFIMLVTGSSLITIYHMIRKPVKSIETAYNGHLESRMQQLEEQELSGAEEKQFQWTDPIPQTSSDMVKSTSTIPVEAIKKKKSDSKFDIDIDISDDKKPDEESSSSALQSIEEQSEPTVAKISEIKTAELDEVLPKRGENSDTKELVDVRDVLADWGLDSPVEYVSLSEHRDTEPQQYTIELEKRPHPLEADIEQAREEDVLKVVQEYLNSIKTSDDYEEEHTANSIQAEDAFVGYENDDVEYQQDDDVYIETFNVDDSVFAPMQNPFEAQVDFRTDSWEEALVEPEVQEATINLQAEVEEFVPETPVPKLKPLESYTPNPWDEVVARVNSEVVNSHVAPKPSSTNVAPPIVGLGEDNYYRLPSIDILENIATPNNEDITAELQNNAEKLVSTLESFGVKTRIIDIARGPSVTRYELQPAPGVKISKITGLADDIALNLAAAGIRIEAPIPNKAAVGVEIPNKIVSLVRIKELIDSAEFEASDASVGMALGKDITGNRIIADIATMPHMLIAGSTGSGKSVCINSIILSILFKYPPDEVKLLMIDPKVVELGVYNGIPHLLVPVVTDPKKAAGALSWAVSEMLKRYKIFAENSVRDINGYNRLVEKNDELEYMPKVVIIIDELADLMMAAPNEVEDSILRLAQMARAAGMHLVIATQRPSVDVITGVIKANVPSRIAFAVSSQIDSRTILDMAGAEKLLGRGDMLFYPVGAAKPIRVQGCFVTDKEVEKVVKHVKSSVPADYSEEIVEEIERLAVVDKSSGSTSSNNGLDDEDEMMPYAIEAVVEAGQASTSMLQRRLKLGYARAARVIDQLEERGIVGPFEGSKPRQVLISKDQYLQMKLSGFDKPNAGNRPKQREDLEYNE